MRVENSIKNAIVSSVMNIITILMGFIFQKIFVITLGKEYLGINGLFNNIISILSIVELGFGSAIVYHLYKPIVEKNYKLINMFIRFYRKTYNIIAFIILLLGLALMPFLKGIVGPTTIDANIYIIFLLFLLDVVSSYLLTYKRSILYANQKTYISNFIHIGYVLLLNIVGMIILLTSHNYIFYLIIKIFFRLLENVVTTIYVNKKYIYLRNKVSEPLPSDVKSDILKKVKGLLFHKIGSSIVFGSDNIIISKIFGLITVGLYSNYYMIFNAISTLLYQIFISITASVGNLLVEDNVEKSYNIYKKLLFINSWIYCFAGTCILLVIQPFIKIWLGNDFLLSNFVLIILVFNFYIQGLRKTSITFKEAAGIFYEDRFIPLIEALLNIVTSIVFAKIFGLAGVFIGTICSVMIWFLYSYPIVCYKKLFNRSYFQFLTEHARYIAISVFAFFISFLIVSILNINNLIISIIVNLVISCVLVNVIYYVIFRNYEEFKYYINILKKIIKKIGNMKIVKE